MGAICRNNIQIEVLYGVWMLADVIRRLPGCAFLLAHADPTRLPFLAL